MGTNRPLAASNWVGATVTRLRPVRASEFDDPYREEQAGLVRTAMLIVGSLPIAEELV